jgi:hypothetical protein
MYKKFIDANETYDNKFTHGIKRYGKEFKEFRSQEVKNYMTKTDKGKEMIQNGIELKKQNLKKELFNLLQDLGACDLELDMIKLSKEIEQKNADISKKERAILLDGTMNKWTGDPKVGCIREYEEIKNMVYKMHFRVYTRTQYISSRKESAVLNYEVSWAVGFNSDTLNSNYCSTIQGVKRTFKADEYETMLKYIEGRKKAYKHLFLESRPQIPADKKEVAMLHDVLLEGFRIGEV